MPTPSDASRFRVMVLALGFVCSVSLAACSSEPLEPAPGSDVAAAPSDTGSGENSDTANQFEALDYPSGPYGLGTGEVMGDFSAEGYLRVESTGVNTAETDYRVWKLSELRDLAMAKGIRSRSTHSCFGRSTLFKCR